MVTRYLRSVRSTIVLAALALPAGTASADQFIGGWQAKYPVVKY